MRYQKDNLTYKVGSCSAIPIADNSVDIVISFETIEHHDQHEDMMREIKRVLKKTGLAIISSPDKRTYSDLRNYQNPFHVKELYQDEFESLLAKHFRYHSLYAQRLVIGSLISKTGELTAPTQNTLADSGRAVTTDKIPPWYLVAFASDIEVDHTCNSILESDIDSFLEAVLAPEKKNAEDQINYRQALANDLRNQLDAEKENAEAQINYRQTLIDDLSKQLKDLEKQMAAEKNCATEQISELEMILGSRTRLLKLLFNPRRKK